MQILRWLFKGAQEEQAKETTPSNNKQTASTVQKPVCKDLVVSKRKGIFRRSKKTEECETRKCFYSTLNLKTLGSFPNSNHWPHEVIIKDEGLAQELRLGHMREAAAHAGNKVLTVFDATVPTVANDQCGSSEKKDKPNRNKTKAISKMKELLKWAAAAKAEKGGKYISRKVLHARNYGALKAASHDDDSSFSSAKIRSKWDLGSCSTSTSSSAFSGFSSFTSSSRRTDQTQIEPIISSIAEDVSVPYSNAKEATTLNQDREPIISSAAEDVSVPDSNAKEAITSSQDRELCTSRRGNWITTDDDFVVLDL